MPVTVKSYSPPAGNVAPTRSGPKFTATFGVKAEFDGSPCSNGEYRQYVKGRFVANGSQLTHYLCPGDAMSVDNYKEDGCLATCTAYGHRSCPADPIDRYTPLQASGCNFEMSDSPGFNNMTTPGEYLVDLHFKGDLIDTSASNAEPLRSATWRVNGTTTVAATTTSSLPPAKGWRQGDKIVQAHFSRNTHTAALEVHIVISRSKDAPPLDVTRVNITLLSDDDVAVMHIGAAVHEIANKSGATATIVYTLAPGQSAPSKVRLGKDNDAPALVIRSHP
jgi:hypothetical protein